MDFAGPPRTASASSTSGTSATTASPRSEASQHACGRRARGGERTQGRTWTGCTASDRAIAGRTCASRASARTSALSPRCSDIDLDIAKGEFVCFLGPSGCGKTTLLRIIAGLEVQTAGTHRAGRARHLARCRRPQRDYGIVFQSYALFPNLTIADNVAYGLVNRRKVPREQSRRASTELLTLVGLPDAGASIRRQLSGGQQQRVALARALATSPGLAAARRAAVGAGRASCACGCAGDPRTAAAARRDHDHGHARSGRGAVDGRPHCGDEPRRDRAGRHAAGGLPRAGVAVRRRLRRQGQRAGRHRGRAGGACASAPTHSIARTAFAAGSELRVYLRPEDVLARPDRRRRPQRVRSADREDRVHGLRTAWCAWRARCWRHTSSPCTCRSTTWPRRSSRSAAACRCALLPERMRIFE